VSTTFNAALDEAVPFVMATVQGYGPALRRRIRPVITGVCPVEAAIGLTQGLAERHAQSNLPRLVVSLGSAGSAKLEHTGLYQAHSVSYRDLDASLLGFENGRKQFVDRPAAT
jgi:adenosylhomocysteine nucleosidase